MLEVLSRCDGRTRRHRTPSEPQKGVNCTSVVAAVAAASLLAMLRSVPRPRIAPCDQSWDFALQSPVSAAMFRVLVRRGVTG